ncbi:DUF975 family protein [Streptococcus parauberis]|uniref:DUF975 family protein n=1 Tax=Streptococcus parauberis TaxID=1348 RepID=UPI0037BA5D44
MSISQIKKEAKQALKGLPGKTALFLVPILIQFALIFIQVREGIIQRQGVEPTFAASLFPLILNIISAFFITSAAFTMLQVLRGRRTEVSFQDASITLSSQLVWKLIGLFLLRFLLLLLWIIIFIVGLSMSIIGYTILTTEGASAMAIALLFIGVPIALGGLYLSINRQLAYAIAEYVLYDQTVTESYQGAVSAIDKSKELMKGYKWKFFLLQLSFIGWYILVFCSLGLLYFYVTPYFTTACANFYRHLDDKLVAVPVEEITDKEKKTDPIYKEPKVDVLPPIEPKADSANAQEEN